MQKKISYISDSEYRFHATAVARYKLPDAVKDKSVRQSPKSAAVFVPLSVYGTIEIPYLTGPTGVHGADECRPQRQRLFFSGDVPLNTHQGYTAGCSGYSSLIPELCPHKTAMQAQISPLFVHLPAMKQSP